jgi:site-specific DNA-methyltransferase (adenine-specific)
MAVNRQRPLLVKPIAQGDAQDWLARLPAQSVDLIVTDPPYASLDKHRARGTTTRLQGGWFETIPDSAYPDLMRSFYSILRPNTHCYVFTDAETMFPIKAAGEAAGFKFWKPLVWNKMRMGMGYHYRAKYELILFFEKGYRKLRRLATPDVLEVPRLKPSQRRYPTEKPVELLKILIDQSARPGEIVADPFMGSGSTLVAAKALGCEPWGCDLEQKSYDLTMERLA